MEEELKWDFVSLNIKTKTIPLIRCDVRRTPSPCFFSRPRTRQDYGRGPFARDVSDDDIGLCTIPRHLFCSPAPLCLS